MQPVFLKYCRLLCCAQFIDKRVVNKWLTGPKMKAGNK